MMDQFNDKSKSWLDRARISRSDAAKFALPAPSRLTRGSGGGGEQTLTVWPSGDFSVGLTSPPKPDKDTDPLSGIFMRLKPWMLGDDAEYRDYRLSKGDRPYEVVVPRRDLPPTDCEMPPHILEALWGIIERTDDEQAAKTFLERYAGPLGIPHNNGLVSSVKFQQNSSKCSRRAKRKPSLGITAHGKRTLRSAAVLMEREFGRANLAFATLTVPPLSPREMTTICKDWSTITNEFVVWLRRQHPLIAQYYAYTNELQDKRTLSCGGIPVPHLHFLFPSRLKDHQAWFVTKEQLTSKWSDILSRKLRKRLPTPWATRIETPRKSVAKELGKYISKGTKSAVKAVERGLGYLLPKQWWGCARHLTRMIRAETVKVKGKIAAVVVDSLEQLERVGILKHKKVKIARPVTNTNGDVVISATGQPMCRELVVGFVGFFTVANFRQFLVETRQEMQMLISHWVNSTNNCCRSKSIA